ncbi:MAG: RDD family protein [Phycisphaerae bacterium]|nr:RDD family protein [Phycisphaerae bacterium]
MPARAADPPKIGLAASDQLIWVYHRQSDSEGKLLLHFASRRVAPPAEDRFLPLFRTGLQGAVMQSAAMGDSLYVFYRDGTHRRYSRPVPTWDATSTKVQHVEINLPRSTVPTALAADVPASTLYALITTRVARDLSQTRWLVDPALDTGTPAAENANANANDASPGSDVPASESGAPLPGTDYVVVRYTGQWWVYDRPAPDDLTVSAEVASMLARDAKLYLVYRRDREKRDFVARRSASPDEPWSPPQALPLADVPADWGGGWVDGQPVLVDAQREQDHLVISSLHLQEGQWKVGPKLADEHGSPSTFHSPVAITVFDGRAFVATESGEDGADVVIGQWSLDTGKLETGPQPVLALDTSPAAVSPQTRMLVEYAVIGALVASLFLWRRSRVFMPLPLPKEVQLAPLSTRLAAAVLDMLLLSPLWSLVFFALWSRAGYTVADLASRSAAATAQQSGAMELLLPLCGAIYAVYGTVFELAMSATPGKRVWGLKVLRADGTPRTFSAVLVRNLTRIVEFEMVLLFVLIGLTPNRQRLGDVLAGTVVVAPAPIDISERRPGSSESDDKS